MSTTDWLLVGMLAVLVLLLALVAYSQVRHEFLADKPEFIDPREVRAWRDTAEERADETWIQNLHDDPTGEEYELRLDHGWCTCTLAPTDPGMSLIADVHCGIHSPRGEKR